MARPEVGAASGAPQPDDLDALFEVDHGMDEMFDAIRREKANKGNNTREPKEVTYGRTRPAEALGIDEEVKITKKRAPVAKLDEARLTSEAGIPKLQKISKTRFNKFKGKGHEFSDVARILRTYQQWLDDLYPRAKFADGLTIIEKLGHTKRMQIRRKAWIDEGRPKASVEDEASDIDEPLPATPNPGSEPSANEITHAGNTLTGPSLRPSNNENDQNEAHESGSNQLSLAGSRPNQQDREEPDEDELDALFAEDQIGNLNEIIPKPGLHRPAPPVDHPMFDNDDEDAMREMDDLW